MENLTLGTLATWATIVISLITLGTLIVKPFISINKNLTKMTGILNDIQREIKSSIDDRKVLHEKVEHNHKRLEDHNGVLIEYGVRIDKLEEKKQ